MSITQRIKLLYEFTQLRKHFLQYFQVVPALTDDLIREAQSIRHEVYCKELGWEPVQADGLEKDRYDPHSLHCLLKSVKTGKYIGCIRLVLPFKSNDTETLPLQTICASVLKPGHPDPYELEHHTTAEISRLAIVHEYRRRKNEQGHPVAITDNDYGTDERRKFPYIPVGLYLGMLHMGFNSGIRTLYILTEPHLAKHFSKLGGQLEAVGEGIEHRGLRIPYRMNIYDVLHGAHFMLRPLKMAIQKEVTDKMHTVSREKLCPTANN